MSANIQEIVSALAANVIKSHKDKFLAAAQQMMQNPANQQAMAAIFAMYDQATQQMGVSLSSLSIPVAGGQAAAFATPAGVQFGQAGLMGQPVGQPTGALPKNGVRRLEDCGACRVPVTTSDCPKGIKCGVVFTKKEFAGTTFYCSADATVANPNCHLWTCPTHKKNAGPEPSRGKKKSGPTSGSSVVSASQIQGLRTPTNINAFGGASANNLASLMQQVPSAGQFNPVQQPVTHFNPVGTFNPLAPTQQQPSQQQLSQQLMSSVQGQVNQLPPGQVAPAGATVNFANLMAQASNPAVQLGQPIQPMVSSASSQSIFEEDDGTEDDNDDDDEDAPTGPMPVPQTDSAALMGALANAGVNPMQFGGQAVPFSQPPLSQPSFSQPQPVAPLSQPPAAVQFGGQSLAAALQQNTVPAGLMAAFQNSQPAPTSTPAAQPQQVNISPAPQQPAPSLQTTSATDIAALLSQAPK